MNVCSQKAPAYGILAVSVPWGSKVHYFPELTLRSLSQIALLAELTSE